MKEEDVFYRTEKPVGSHWISIHDERVSNFWFSKKQLLDYLIVKTHLDLQIHIP